MNSETINKRREQCLACGGELAECLVHLGSLRCHDCRDAHEPLRSEPVQRWPRPTLVVLNGGAGGWNTVERIAA